MDIKRLKINEIKSNPNNPRFIKDEKFKQLVKSIKEFPDMLEARELVLNKDYVILGGNMRFKAAKEAGVKELPVKIVDWPEDKQKEFIIKDNISGGEWDWDILANEWNYADLEDWGLDTPTDFDESSDEEENEAEVDTKPVIVVVAYNDYESLDKLTDFYNLKSVDMPKEVKDELGRQKKIYVFEK